MMQEVAFKTLFAPLERFLIGNQTKTFVLNPDELYDDSHSSDSEIICNEIELR